MYNQFLQVKPSLLNRPSVALVQGVTCSLKKAACNTMDQSLVYCSDIVLCAPFIHNLALNLLTFSVKLAEPFNSNPS